MSRSLSVALFVVAVSAAACHHRSAGGRADSDANARSAPVSSDTASSDTLTRDSLQLRAQAPAVELLGTAVALKLTVRNQADHTQEFSYGGVVPVDFIIRNGTGQFVWSVSAAMKMIVGTDIITYLKPGESRVFRALWNQRDTSGAAVGRGTYHVLPVVSCCPSMMSMRSFTISIR